MPIFTVWLVCLVYICNVLLTPGVLTPVRQSSRFLGTGFSLESEAVAVVDGQDPRVDFYQPAMQRTEFDVHAGNPVSDHWSCHQVRQKLLEDIPKSKRIAILIPFREQSGRERHRELATLLETLLPFGEKLTREEGASFKVYVVEQSNDGHFNRGALMDVGFQFAYKFFGEASFSVVAQDCDFVPDQRMIQWYSRSGEAPIHLASYVYCPGFGGVTIFRNDQYEAMDGYSHSMWGWGGEDDDAMDRWMSDPSRIVLAPSSGERFKDLGKVEDKARDKTRYAQSMEVWKRDNRDQNWVREGLAGLNYTLLSRVPHDNPLVEHIVVRLSSTANQ